MLLSSVGYDEVHFSTLEDSTRRETYELFVKRMKNGNGAKKFITLLKKSDETLGYIYYTLETEKESSSFIGIEVLNQQRGLGLSNAIFSSYFNLLKQNSIFDFKTKKQKKPFTSFILINYGYMPVNVFSGRQVDILKPTDDKVRLYFHREEARKVFESSRIFRSGQYCIVEELLENPIKSIQINSGYVLEDFELFERKIHSNSSRFKILE